MRIFRVQPRELRFPGFVALVAGLMATNQLALDAMLPGLPSIAHGLGMARPNDAQWVVTAFVLGLGVAQLGFGAFADRFGRRPVLLVGMAIYTLFGVLAAVSTSFEVMIVARFFQGVGAAASRVISTALVRDKFVGHQMARVMSLAMLVLMAAPIIAPSLGQLVLLVASWRWLFAALAAIGVILFLCVLYRLPETLDPANRLPLSPRRLAGAFVEVLTTPRSVGYNVAQTLVAGAGMGFLTSAQQIFVGVLKVGTWFPVCFAAGAAAMGVAAFLNSRIVVRFGAHRVAHTALMIQICGAGVFCLVTLAGHQTVWTFMPFQILVIFCLGLVGSNFGAIAMIPLGHIAGTAASVQGFIVTCGSAMLGVIIGQAFNGTALPVGLGYFLLGLAALAVVAATERGDLTGSWRVAHG